MRCQAWNGWQRGRHSPWDRVIAGTLLCPGQAARLPLSAEVSLRTIRSRWKRWHLAFPCAPPLPVNGSLAVSSTLELVPQHSLVEAQARHQSLSCRAAYPPNPFVRGPICLHKQAVCFWGNSVCNEPFMIRVCGAAEAWTKVLLKRSNTTFFHPHLTSPHTASLLVVVGSHNASSCPAVWYFSLMCLMLAKLSWRATALSAFMPVHLSNYLFLIPSTLKHVLRGARQLTPRWRGHNEKSPEGGLADGSQAGGIGTVITSQQKPKWFGF